MLMVTALADSTIANQVMNIIVVSLVELSRPIKIFQLYSYRVRAIDLQVL